MPRTIRDELVEMDRPFIDVFRTLTLPFGLKPLFGPDRYFPTTDVFTRNGDLVIDVDLPGIDPAKDVTVTFVDGELTIKGERKEKTEVTDHGYYRREAVYGTFERHIPMPEGTQESEIDAEYKAGVLEIVIPRHEAPAAKPKTIPVKAPASHKV